MYLDVFFQNDVSYAQSHRGAVLNDSVFYVPLTPSHVSQVLRIVKT